MKIKTVCELTGLTDRSVRYYIEEHLITPAYTENYLGRKSFDFSAEDVQLLKNISVFRKFGFSIAEIKQMLINPAMIFPIAKKLLERKQATLDEASAHILILLQLDKHHHYTLTEFANHLSTTVVNNTLPPDEAAPNIGRMIACFFRALPLAIVTWFPVILSILVGIAAINDDAYPVFNVKAFILLVVSLFPTCLLLLLPRFKLRLPWSSIAKGVLVFLCVLSIPVSSIFALGLSIYSETSDIVNYRRFDTDCLANRAPFFQELFPLWPHYFVNEEQPDGSWETVYLDAHYYYCKRPAMDYTYDIYAEWPLEKTEFDKEVSRVQALYENNTKKYDIIHKGNYTCFFAYDGDPPFEEATDSYTYYIFAFDEQNLTVRYIMCDSLENGVDQPYYLSLDW